MSTIEFNSDTIKSKTELTSLMNTYLSKIKSGEIDHALITENEHESACFRITGINLLSRLYNFIKSNIVTLEDDLTPIFDLIKSNTCLSVEQSNKYNKYLILQTLIQNYDLKDASERKTFTKGRLSQIIYPEEKAPYHNLKITDYIELYQNVSFVTSKYDSIKNYFDSYYKYNLIVNTDLSDQMNEFITEYSGSHEQYSIDLLSKEEFMNKFSNKLLTELKESIKEEITNLTDLIGELNTFFEKVLITDTDIEEFEYIKKYITYSEIFYYDDKVKENIKDKSEKPDLILFINGKIDNLKNILNLEDITKECDLSTLIKKNKPKLQEIFAFDSHEGLLAIIPFSELLKLIDFEFQEKFTNPALSTEVTSSGINLTESAFENLEYLKLQLNLTSEQESDADFVNKIKKIIVNEIEYQLVGISRITRNARHAESAICSNKTDCDNLQFKNVSDNVKTTLDFTDLITKTTKIDFLLYEKKSLLGTLVTTSKYFKKYLKYKNKYLSLKKIIN